MTSHFPLHGGKAVMPTL